MKQWIKMMAGTAIQLIHSMALKPMTTVPVMRTPPTRMRGARGSPRSLWMG